MFLVVVLVLGPQLAKMINHDMQEDKISSSQVCHECHLFGAAAGAVLFILIQCLRMVIHFLRMVL